MNTSKSIWLGKEIEITHVNPLVKSIGIVIHLYCAPVEVAQPHTQAKVAELVKIGCKYLQDEGFIPRNPDGWMTHIGGMAHGKPL